MAAAPASAATAPDLVSAAADDSESGVFGPLPFELPLKRSASERSRLFDGTTRGVKPIEHPMTSELGDLLLRAIDSWRQTPQYVVQELGHPEHNAAESNLAIDEAFQDLVFDVAPNGEAVHSTLDDDRWSGVIR
jgi:hypothetical protein